MSDIESQLAAQAKAPRITPADIEAQIAQEFYFTARDGIDGADISSYRNKTPYESIEIIALKDDVPVEGTPLAPLSLLTFCVLLLRNGFMVTGESACASPENFDAEIGRRIARQNAVQKIWPLLGFQLRTTLWHQQQLLAERAGAADEAKQQ